MGQSASTTSDLNKKTYVNIEIWRNRPLQGEKYPYAYVDGYREVLGAAEGMKEEKASWVSFFQWLRERSLSGVKLIAGDKCLAMPEAVGEVFPEAKYLNLTAEKDL